MDPIVDNGKIIIQVHLACDTHFEKMGWFATSLAIGVLSCNDHSQFATTRNIFTNVNAIVQVAWVATYTTHYMWNYIHMYISTSVSVIGQVTWILTYATHYMWNHIHMQ